MSQIQSRTLHCCRSTVLEIWTHELIHFLSFATSLSAKPWCSRLAESGLSSVQFSQSVVAYSQFSVYYARSYAACLSVRPTNARSQRVRQPYVRLSDNHTMAIFGIFCPKTTVRCNQNGWNAILWSKIRLLWHSIVLQSILLRSYPVKNL